MKFVSVLAGAALLLSAPAVAATRPGQAMPVVGTGVAGKTPVRVGSAVKKKSDFAALGLAPLLVVGAVAAVAVVVVVATDNQSNG